MKNLEHLHELRTKIADLLGLYFSDTRLGDLERGLILAARDLKMEESIPKIHQWLTTTELSRNEFKVLAKYLTVGETYFFREQASLDFFRLEIMPYLLESRKNKTPVRIWCAGCSSGEEPYSIAMIFLEYFPAFKPADFNILATDVSPVALDKAFKGIYSEWSFRTTSQYLKEKYFTKSGSHYIIKPEIQKMVTFSFLNLASNSYPSSLTNTESTDVIFCRNVLMYFSPELIKTISNRFFDALTDNGWLITSQVELNDEYFSRYQRVQYNNGIFYQKTEKSISRSQENRNVKPDLLDLPTFTHVQKTKKQAMPKIELQKTETTKTEPISVLASKPSFSESDIKLLFEAGKYREICELVEKYNANNELETFLLPIIARTYANLGYYKEAKHFLEKYMKQSQTTPDQYFLYASVLVEQNEYDDAEKVLKKAIYLNPDHIASHLMIGNIMNRQGKTAIASKYFKNAFTLLDQFSDDEVVAETDGMTAGRIKNMIMNLI